MSDTVVYRMNLSFRGIKLLRTAGFRVFRVFIFADRLYNLLQTVVRRQHQGSAAQQRCRFRPLCAPPSTYPMLFGSFVHTILRSSSWSARILATGKVLIAVQSADKVQTLSPVETLERSKRRYDFGTSIALHFYCSRLNFHGTKLLRMAENPR